LGRSGRIGASRFRSRRTQSPLQPTGGTQFLAIPLRQAEADLPQCLSMDRLLGSGWCCGDLPSTQVGSRASASVAVQRMDADAARYNGYYAQQIPPAYYRLVRRSRDRTPECQFPSKSSTFCLRRWREQGEFTPTPSIHLSSAPVVALGRLPCSCITAVRW